MTDPSNEPQDGFDLIEYPCEFNFKAMCRADEEQDAEAYIRSIIEPMINQDDLIRMHSNVSRTGKFESVTAVIKLDSRDQLESIYKAISSAPKVVMTL